MDTRLNKANSAYKPTKKHKNQLKEIQDILIQSPALTEVMLNIIKLKNNTDIEVSIKIKI